MHTMGNHGLASRRMVEILIIGFELASGNLCVSPRKNSFQEAELEPEKEVGVIV